MNIVFEKTRFRFDDDVVAHIAKTLQYALLTGTDITDHLRNISLEEKGNLLKLDVDYVKVIEDFERQLLERASELASEDGKDVTG